MYVKKVTAIMMGVFHKLLLLLLKSLTQNNFKGNMMFHKF